MGSSTKDIILNVTFIGVRSHSKIDLKQDKKQNEKSLQSSLERFNWIFFEKIYSLTSMSTPDGKSNFIRASIVLEDG